MIWWNCSLFGKRAESLAQYLTKGQAVTIIGGVTERDWTDKQGVARKSIDVRVSDVALMGGRKDSQDAPSKPKHGPLSTPEKFESDEIPF